MALGHPRTRRTGPPNGRDRQIPRRARSKGFHTIELYNALDINDKTPGRDLSQAAGYDPVTIIRNINQQAAQVQLRQLRRDLVFTKCGQERIQEVAP
jgi:hypothetical protein